MSLANILKGLCGFKSDRHGLKLAEAEFLDYKRLLNIVEFLPDATFVIDKAKRVVVWNRACEIMTGVKKDKLLGKGDFAYAEPFFGQRRPMVIDLLDKPQPEIEKLYKYVRRGKNTILAESFNPVLHGGKGAHLWVVAGPLYNDSGERVGAIEIVRDVTEHKKVEQSLRESELKHRTLFEAAHDAIFIVRNYCFAECNDRTLEVYGCTREQILGATPQSFSPERQPDGRLSVESAMEKMSLALSGTPQFFEWQHRRLDGSTFMAEVSLNRLELGEGDVLQAIVRDVTERKKAEEALKLQKIQLQNISDNLDKAMLYQIVRYPDDKRKCTYVSGKVEEFYGVSPAEMMNDVSLLYGKVHPDDKARVAAAELEALADKRPLKTEARMFNPDGSLRWSYFVSVPKYLSDGSTSWDGIEFDITERKSSEEELKRALEAKSAFTSMVSHELRTPLTVIKESIHLMSKGLLGPINEKQQKHLDMERKNVDRLSRLLGEVLDYQALQSGKIKFNILPNDINEVIKEVCETMTPLAVKKGLEMTCETFEGCEKALFDRDRITEVLINIVNNAIRLTDSGTVKVRSEMKDGRVLVSVADTGPGISKADMPRLFKQFEQLKRIPGGTGLGLAISKDIIVAHGGRIWAESKFGSGTVFYFELPLATGALCQK